MPKSVVELAQLNTFSRSSDGGQLSDTATRGFKVILNAPNESWNVHTAIGYNIGDPYDPTYPNDLPMVSVDVRAEGESRMVRLVTATFRNTPGGVDGSGGGGSSRGDRRKQAPEVRAPLYSMSTSLQEVPASSWRRWAGGVLQGNTPAANPVGDMFDGITKLEPVTTISIEQFSFTDGTLLLDFVGAVNSDLFRFSGLNIQPHNCMFQNVSSVGHVENFNGVTFRGFKLTFQFIVKKNWALLSDGAVHPIGWDQAVPLSGYNIINGGLGNAAVDETALALAHENFLVKDPRELAPGTEGKKVRAHILHAAKGEEPGAVQGLAAQPVALNLDGTPRNVQTQNPPVLIERYATQQPFDFGDNFASFGINSFF